ncbi:MAG: AsmA-like C-terminal region-containing protein [Candidatus Omnitrophota bacterium]|nr:AsmA-like C-terminal region-containing protein [Candidatus Omnitrophota bacterium]
MKAVKFFFLALGILFVVVAIAAFIFIKTFNVNTYLPQITKAASDALGREVSIAAAGLDFSWQGIAVDVFDIRVAGEPSIEAGKASVQMGLMPLLRQRKVHVTHIIISDIRVNAGDAQTPLDIRIPKLEAHVNDLSLDAPLPVSGEAFFTDGRLENFNVLKAVLGRINVIPGLGEQIEGLLSETLREKLGGDTTALDRVRVKFTLRQGQILIDDAVVQSPLFEAGIKGTAGFDGNVSMDVSFYAAKDLSQEITRFITPLQGILDQDGRLYVPGKLIGQAPKVRYVPNAGYLAKKIVTGEGIKQISQQLEKVLDKNPEVKEILNSVLNGIFK